MKISKKDPHLPSNKQLNRIGDKLRKQQELTADEQEVFNYWRSAHNQALIQWQSILRSRLKKLKLQKSVLLGQRLKRRNTIQHKLERYNAMQLSRMNDIAGCRLVFKSMKELQIFRKSLHENSYFKHELKNDPKKFDYVESPKSDGYRGFHDVYICAGSEKTDGLAVEIQFRTRAQHAWATTVESIGMLTGIHLKLGHKDPDSFEYFKVCSEMFARAFEGRHSVYGQTDVLNLLWMYWAYELSTGVLKRLTMYRTVVKRFPDFKGARAVLLSFEPKSSNEQPQISIKLFNSQAEAIKRYAEEELRLQNVGMSDVVLVRADNKRAVKALFPNYFIDSGGFIGFLNDAIKILLDENKDRRVGFVRRAIQPIEIIILKTFLEANTLVKMSGGISKKNKDMPSKVT